MVTLYEELIAPIQADNFCGEDPQYEAEFEAAKLEMEKNSGNDFNLIEAESKKLLTAKAKDMRSLGFLCLSVGINRGLTALGEAAQAYAELTKEHWEKIHPLRPAARLNALKWLNGERVIFLLEALNGSTSDYPALLAAQKAFSELGTFLQEKSPEGSTAYLNFFKVIRGFAERYKPEEPKAEAEASSSSASGGNAGNNNSSSAGTLDSVSDAEVLLQKVAGYYLENQVQSPLGYRLLRMTKWTDILSMPPNQNGLTEIPPPDAEIVQVFANLVESQDWANLSSGVENAFTRDDMLFWFDLQRYACLALQGMGGEYATCAKAIMLEIALLLQRLPNLPNLQYSDGTPFADALTRDWLNDTVKAALGGGGGGFAIKRKGDIAEEAKQANELMSENKLEEAVAVYRTGIVNDSSALRNFDRRYLIAELFYHSKKLRMAQFILQELLDLMQRHDLENWDGEICLNAYILLFKVYNAIADAADEIEKPQLKAKAEQFLQKVGRLDPVKAMQLSV